MIIFLNPNRTFRGMSGWITISNVRTEPCAHHPDVPISASWNISHLKYRNKARWLCSMEKPRQPCPKIFKTLSMTMEIALESHKLCLKSHNAQENELQYHSYKIYGSLSLSLDRHEYHSPQWFSYQWSMQNNCPEKLLNLKKVLKVFHNWLHYLNPPKAKKMVQNCAWNLEHDKYVLRVFSLYNLCIQISFSEIMPMTFLTLNRSSCSPFINISRNSLYHLSNSIALLSFHQYIQKLTLPPFLQQLVFTAAMKWTIKMFFSNHYTLTYSQHLSSPFLCNIYLSSPFPIGHLHHYTA